ncbi:MAG: hypothetical protein AABW47_03975 [Nanoarchaeota archaeon]
MKLSHEKLVEIVNDSILPNRDFQEALNIVRENSSGKIWLVGGFLYKNLAHYLYGSKKSTKDFDLIVENSNDKLTLPKDWAIRKNHFDGLKFVNEEKQIDFIPLARVCYCEGYPSIDNFLKSGGLNIHCLAYDIFNNEILGEVGIKALEQKIIASYNLKVLEEGTRRYGRTPNDLIKTKAEELGFKAQLTF